MSDKELMGLFSLGRRRDPATGEASRNVAALVREALALGEADAVTASEITCGDPACLGGAETVILVMRPKIPTRAVKIAKALVLVTDDDVQVAIEQLRLITVADSSRRP